MKKDVSSIFLGLIFLAAGVAVGGSMLGFFDFQFSMAGWWTIFIIAPALISIVQGGFNAGNFIVLAVGVCLLLRAQGYLPAGFSWRLILPGVLLIIGIQLLFGGQSKTKVHFCGCSSTSSSGKPSSDTSTDKTAESDQKGDYKSASVFFSGQDIQYAGMRFAGATYSAVFGGMTVDLRNAVLVGDVVINVSCLCGGIEITLPDNVQITTNVVPILGGTECTYRSSNDPGATKICVRGNATLGGVTIK